ncbi:PAS domain S-box-containing protein/diguanylate cyclase (GGDEF)-like protein [Marinobacter pelagius]|uniref:cyclic-guanylate-specific phosphodiesterase n=1 Tax=Marinobacter pelagius TaxID=379482 RepID=A0A366GQ03_9GAMM|nr:EAL domain-containing protein [Marinobacter pelagius]RBP28331.1 PAS domain S-box-containing protein/diguanylate cyclase (GGDEF)-like protein [Marinobacter pelagius]
MIQSPSELRLQATLLILFSCSLFIGLLSLIVDVFPFLAIPERLILAPAGAFAVILAGFSLFALTFPKPLWRILAGALLALLGSYGLVTSAIALHADNLPFLSDRTLGLPTLPSIAVLLMAGVSLLGLRGSKGSLFGFITGCFGVGIGAMVMISHVQPNLDSDNDGLIWGFSVLSGVLCTGIGVVLVILSEHRPQLRFSMSRHQVVVGALSVASTFALFLLASWGVHVERHQGAQSILQHYAGALEHGVDNHLKMIERLANRWAAFEYDVPEALEATEVNRYFDDTPALESILIVQNDGAPLWRTARSPFSLMWLMDQSVKPEVLSWLRESRTDGPPNGWLIPDEERPYKALALVTVGESQGAQMLAAFDLQTLLSFEAPHRSRDFDITLVSRVPQVKEPDSGEPEVEETTTVPLPNGPNLLLRATAGPPNPKSLQGGFPLAVLVFGLTMSYLLIMGRSLLGVYKNQARALNVSEQQFRSLFSQTPDAILAFDQQGYYRMVNPIARRIIGLKESDIGVTHYLQVLKKRDISDHEQGVFETAFGNAAAGHAQKFEITLTSQHISEARTYECDLLPIVVDGKVSGVFLIGKDITERLNAQESQRILKRSLESSDNGVVVVDYRSEGLPVVFVNPAFSQMTGYSEAELLGAPVQLLSGPETDEKDIEQIRQAARAGQPLSLTLKSYRRDGSPFWNQVSITPVRDHRQEVSHFTAIMRDISEKKEQEHRLAYQATHDVLTGLGNRALFEDRLEHDVSLANRKGQLLAVLFIDLDEFKPINDTLGHKIGDELLISVARRLEASTRPTDTLARFGGDEFVLILPALAATHEAEEVAERILETVTKPHRIRSHELHISASIGISFISKDQEHPEKLLQQADMAMYKAKQQGRDTYEIYTPELDNRLTKRVTLRNDLQEAIESRQLFLHYQPQITKAGTLCGLEALVRWNHPEKGFISPADFIPIAEETGQIVNLGKWVTTQACRDARLLLEKGLLKGRMAVNLSPMQFHRPSFLSAIRSILEKTELPAEHLELELTEGILMKDSDGAIDILNALNGMGIATAIDDFGTGFSSFSYLRDLPVDKIKIDRSFVSRINTSEKDAAVCKGMITLAREMNLRVIAEGVETAEEVEILTENGCEAFQGYYFARPMAFDALVDWIAQSQKS